MFLHGWVASSHAAAFIYGQEFHFSMTTFLSSDKVTVLLMALCGLQLVSNSVMEVMLSFKSQTASLILFSMISWSNLELTVPLMTAIRTGPEALTLNHNTLYRWSRWRLKCKYAECFSPFKRFSALNNTFHIIITSCFDLKVNVQTALKLQ